jgi:hypothetical protein
MNHHRMSHKPDPQRPVATNDGMRIGHAPKLKNAWRAALNLPDGRC